MKIKIIFYLLLICVFFTTSCKKKSNLELYLIDKGKKWVYINNEKYYKDSIDQTYGYYVEFNGDGSCHSFSKIDDSPWFSHHNTNNNGNWEFIEKDSSLNVYGIEFKVLEIQEDTISVLRKKDNWKALFINDFHGIENLRKANR